MLFSCFHITQPGPKQQHNLDTQNNKVPNHSIINKYKVPKLFSFLVFKIRNSRLFRIERDECS
ncbi:hypothetical protein C427_4424 [Paraglaciecola psychrophila 170]|uniref:Uncharacterized protein n=1 Tax=Paraglaciecola psychrophila 170 TaxID=1129794 RepID=K6ZTA9_9ALTE|nr:hypothetical protein C427_4424 [Paraglaciecola psychrophila 170]GAC39146.1 hypothetical protein GPSY_3535 [Paraglaciecola psychrophila 170]